MTRATPPRSQEPSVATLLSFLACGAGAVSFFVLTAGAGMPLPLLTFVLSPWLLGMGITFIARSPAWQRAWLACVSVLALANMAVVAVASLSEDLLLKIAATGLPLFNICGVIVAGGISWLIGITLDDSVNPHSPPRHAASDHQTSSRTPRVSAQSLDDQTANSESRPDPGHTAP